MDFRRDVRVRPAPAGALAQVQPQQALGRLSRVAQDQAFLYLVFALKLVLRLSDRHPELLLCPRGMGMGIRVIPE